MLRILRYDVSLDIVVTVFVLCVNGGSFEGVMAATHRRPLHQHGNDARKGGKDYPGRFRLEI